jgi:hypothetical protein
LCVIAKLLTELYKEANHPAHYGVEKIHECRSHRGENYEGFKGCPNYGANRYMTNKDYKEKENRASNEDLLLVDFLKKILENLPSAFGP